MDTIREQSGMATYQDICAIHLGSGQNLAFLPKFGMAIDTLTIGHLATATIQLH